MHWHARGSLLGTVKTIAAICLFASIGTSRLPAGTTIEVAPGDDLAAAVVRAHTAEKPVVIVLGAGRHELAAPLRLGPADSGLTLQVGPGGPAFIAGSRRVTGWRQTDSAKSLWQCTLPDTASGKWRPRQLFVRGVRATRARTPNQGFAHAGGTLPAGQPLVFPCAPGTVHAEWPARGVELIFYQKWIDARLAIKAADASASTVTLEARTASWMSEPHCRYFIENAPDALDATGEWHLDGSSGVLSFLAPPGLDPNVEQITAPVTDTLIEIDGSHGVTLRALTFGETDYRLPEAGHIDPQAASTTRGALRARNSRDGRVENCIVENTGTYAIDLGEGCRGWRVIGNTLRHLGAGGVRIGETRHENPAGGISVTDNVIDDYGAIHAAAVGVLILHSGNNRVAHNEISNGFYTGISVGWTWGYRDSPCRENIVEFNHVHHIGRGLLSDMGGIYTLGPQPGTIVRNNYFHDIESHDYGGWGLYTDEGSSGIVLENNVVARCKSAGFHQHYGKDNVVRNNLFAFNREHSLMRTREEDHRSFTFERNVVIADSGSLLGSSWSNGRFETDRNLWWDTRHGDKAGEYLFAGLKWPDWQAAGRDRHSSIADPRLIDPANPQRGLDESSPAFALGFKPIDASGIGPRPVSARESERGWSDSNRFTEINSTPQSIRAPQADHSAAATAARVFATAPARSR